MKIIAAVLLASLLSACASLQPGSTGANAPAPVFVPPPPPPPAPVAAPPPAPAPAPVPAPAPLPTTAGPGQNILAREYLYSKEAPASPPYSFVAFPKKPVSKEIKDQYLGICENWKASFPEASEVREQTTSLRILPFYWLLKSKPNSETCENLIKKYDYARAQVLMTSMGLDPSQVLFVYKTRTSVAWMNVTQMRKPEDLARSVDVWHKKMCVTPADGSEVRIYGLADSVRAVLGALGNLIAVR